MMAVNLCAAHKKTVSHAAHEVLLVSFLQSCSTQRWISCTAQNIARMLYRKVNSCVGTGLLCLFFHLLCYAAVLKNFTYYAQNYAQE